MPLPGLSACAAGAAGAALREAFGLGHDGRWAACGGKRCVGGDTGWIRGRVWGFVSSCSGVF